MPALCPYHTGWQDALAGVGGAPCSQAREQGCQEGMRRDQGRWQEEGVGGLTAQGDGEAQEWCQPGVRRCWGGADTWLPRPRPQGPPGPFDGQQAGAAPRRLALLGGGQVDPGCPSACPACLQALNGWEPFVGEQLAAGPLCGAVGKSAGSLSHPLQSPDYLGASRTPSQGCPPPAGVGVGAPQRSCLPSTGPGVPQQGRAPESRAPGTPGALPPTSPAA